MKHLLSVAFVLGILFFAGNGSAQISAPTASGHTFTEYASGEQHDIYIFCGQPDVPAGSIVASHSSGNLADFEWFKLNTTSMSFDPYPEATASANNLEDGCYRVNVTSGGVTETYTAWVFNSWYRPEAEISESTCAYFQLSAVFMQADLTYTDLTTGASLQVNRNVRVKWTVGTDLISSVLSPQIYYPPTSNTTYSLSVYDDFGCTGETSVYYESIVPKAAFSASPPKGEAPLDVSFNNQSENADEFEWFFFRDINEIKKEAADQGVVSDSIMDIAINRDPVYTYERSGDYMVKLVATKNSDEAVCRDTIYLDYYIKVDTSYIDAPNFFTPNGDGDNDEFIIYYTSMKSIDLKIFNRWGKEIFEVSKNNLGNFESSAEEIAWDGQIGGRLASPGVYFYVVEGKGRDDRKWKKTGFFHLFREK